MSINRLNEIIMYGEAIKEIMAEEKVDFTLVVNTYEMPSTHTCIKIMLEEDADIEKIAEAYGTHVTAIGEHKHFCVGNARFVQIGGDAN